MNDESDDDTVRESLARSTASLARAEADLARTHRELEELQYAIDAASIIAVTDVKGRIIRVNDKFCEISKYERAELIGKDHRILNSGYHPKSYIRDLWRTIAQGDIWRGELRNRAKDGSHYWVDTTIVPLLDEGRPDRYLAIRTDITERKRVETLLRQKESMAQLGQLAAVIAHEVKNPLAGISGAMQIIARRLPAGSQEVKILEEVKSRVTALDESLTALLDFARPKVPKLRPVSARELVVRSAMVIANDPKYVQAELTIEGPDATIIGDPELLGQALLNLVINAVQAVEGAGQVRVVIEELEREVAISVLDEGPGLPASEDIFQPFFTTKVHGTGLGLPVVRQTAEAHGGTIEARSEPGEGTCFCMRLPRPVPISD